MTETPESGYLDWNHASVDWTDGGYQLTVEIRTRGAIPDRHKEPIAEAVSRAITTHYRVEPTVFVAGNTLYVVDPQLLELDAADMRNLITMAVTHSVDRTNAEVDREKATIQTWLARLRNDEATA